METKRKMSENRENCALIQKLPAPIVVSFLTIYLIVSMLLSSCVSSEDSASGSAGSSGGKEQTHYGIEHLQDSFRSVASEVLPVVVEVTVVEVKKQIVPEGDSNPFLPWNFGPEEEDEKEFRDQGLGSGVIVQKNNENYYVLTNDHVVGEADEINITLYDRRSFRGSLVGRDERKDLALIQFENEDNGIPVASLGNSDTLQVGDWVLALGNPYGFESTVTAGIVSAIGRRGPVGNISDFIQTDAAINQGNSGGALTNIYGEVVGINTWITTPTGGSIGLGFAIPINNAKKAIQDFIDYGEVRYGWLGVSINNLLPYVAENIGFTDEKGAFIYHVFNGSPADKGGLQPGDIILSVNGLEVENADRLILQVGDLTPKEKAHFTLNRFGKTLQMEVVIGIREDAESINELNRNLWPGITILPLGEELNETLGLPADKNGVIVREVEKATKIDEAGIRVGDIITTINNESVENIEDFYTAVNDKKESIFIIIVDRDNTTITLDVKRTNK